MIPWQHLASAQIPDGGGELRLMQRGSEFAIRQGNTELMNSRLSGSEKALADLACDRVASRRRCAILIGGYGMGFTLRAALARLGADAKVTVAELVPEIIVWAQGPMAELTAGCLDDPRVKIHQGDVRTAITLAAAQYDAILLDVDNGPEGLTRSANDKIYDLDGLHAARKALRPGGVLTVWSSSPSADFTRRLQQSGFAVDEKKVRANGTRGAHHVIWIGVNRP